jgi:ATP-dependent 26S proteasome regulatory subunit
MNPTRLRVQAVVKLAENFNGADLRNVCTEAGMFAIRDERDYVVHEVRHMRSNKPKRLLQRKWVVTRTQQVTGTHLPVLCMRCRTFLQAGEHDDGSC